MFLLVAAKSIVAFPKSELVAMSSLASFQVLLIPTDFNFAANICEDNNSP